MDHRPFEGWLLENQPLDAEEKRQLDAHLQVCAACSALAEVNLALKSVKMAEPAVGFADRFQVRLAERKQALRRRNIYGFVFLILSVLSVLTFISWPVITGLLHSPGDLLASWLGSLVLVWVALDAMAHAGLVLFRILPDFVPTWIWMVILFATCGWSLLWILSLIKFVKPPQGE